MKRKRILAMMLAAAVGIGVLAGCGSSDSSSSGETASETEATEETEEESDAEEENISSVLDTSEQVEIVMYVISDRPAGQDVVDENLNEILLEKLNCTLKINWISWSDYANKYPLLFSSGEEFDLIYTSNWLNWTQLARKGAFMELDDLWPTYAPDNYAAASETAIEEATLDGHIYVIPSQLETYFAYGPIYRTVFDNGAVYDGEITDFESMEEYMDWVVENVPDVQPFDVYSESSLMDDIWLFSNGYAPSKAGADDFLYYDTSSDNPQLITLYEYEEVDEFLEMMNRWNEKGFFSKSALSDTNTTKTLTGQAALKIHGVSTYASYAIAEPDWGFEFTNFTDPMSHLPYTQDSVAVSNTSQNPERALALWNLLTTDQEVFDAFYYGVLGTTYELNEKGEYTILDTDLYSTSAMWAAGTTEFSRNAAGTPDDYDEKLASYEESIAEDDSWERFAAFTIDTSNIETEYAACQSVQQQYWWPLELGYTDPVEGLAEYQEKMEAAGIETVRAEIQSQLDEYVDSLSE